MKCEIKIFIILFHCITCSGGYLGGKLYAVNRAYLPLFMGVTMAASALLLKQLMNMDLDASGTSQLACPVLIVSGLCSSSSYYYYYFIDIDFIIITIIIITIITSLNCIIFFTLTYPTIASTNKSNNVQIIWMWFVGALAAINGANIRVVVLNLVTPQARGEKRK